MNYLKLEFHKKEYPYRDEKYDKDINWGQIKLLLYRDNFVLEKELFTIEWDFRDIINWFSINKEALINESFPFSKSHGSIAKKVFDLLEDENSDEDQIDILYEYRTRHGIRFALRGTNIVDLYLGKTNSTYEVSLFDSNNDWRYQIDLIDFVNKLPINY